MDDRFRTRFPRIVLAALIMGGALWLAVWGLTPMLNVPLWRFAALAILVSVGIVSYFGVGTVIGAFAVSDFTALRRRSRDLPKDPDHP